MMCIVIFILILLLKVEFQALVLFCMCLYFPALSTAELADQFL